MSKSKELYEELGKFLLAARLQEGARQVVCETMDAGRPEAFLHLFSVVEENNLIRYPSIKCAISAWIGIFNEKSVDRFSEKLLRLMGQCLRDEAFVKETSECFHSQPVSMLWRTGFRRVMWMHPPWNTWYFQTSAWKCDAVCPSGSLAEQGAYFLAVYG